MLLTSAVNVKTGLGSIGDITLSEVEKLIEDARDVPVLKQRSRSEES